MPTASTIIKIASLCAAALAATAAAAVMGAPPPAGDGTVPLNAGLWEAADAGSSVRFLREDGRDAMLVKGGGALLKNTRFGDGTIEYDIKESPDNGGIPGIWFRQQGTESAENVYLRTDSDCPRSVECVQYAPVSHGNVQWDVYPEYQAGAPVRASGWNHVKLIVSGKRMNVSINGEAAPSLAVGSLAGDAAAGAIELRGDAMFANVRIVPGAVGGLDPAPAHNRLQDDVRFVRHWSLSPVSALPRGEEAALSAMPGPSAAWETIDAEAKGFVNIARQHGTARGVPDLAWLKTAIVSDRAQVKHVALGFAREVWVYVNGQRVYADRNLYYPASGRKPPLGRMALENGGFDLPLRAGANEVVVAVSNDLGAVRHWGWGIALRLDDVDGVTLPVVKTMM